ncbi:MAG TPA: hypothetical protein VFW27_26875, partial [Actinoplanes sp.]|nr:hypothetical protein [Actinoplanes sp.]
ALPAVIVAAVQQIGGHARLARPGIPLWTAVAEPMPGTLAALAGVLLVGAALVVVVNARRADA